MDPALRAYHRNCNYITNMRKACLFLFGKFENLVDFDTVHVRGGYRGPRTIGFVINTLSLEDCFEVIKWFQKQFRSKQHSFYRYTIDVVEGHERLSIFIMPQIVLKNILFEDREDQLSLSVFLNKLNNLNLEYLQMKIQEEIQQRESRRNDS
jgi:hypothetical protein